MQIRIGKLPGRVSTVDLPAGSTVQDALNSASISLGSTDEVRVNNASVAPAQYASFTLSDGASVLITAQVKGN